MKKFFTIGLGVLHKPEIIYNYMQSRGLHRCVDKLVPSQIVKYFSKHLITIPASNDLVNKSVAIKIVMVILINYRFIYFTNDQL